MLSDQLLVLKESPFFSLLADTSPDISGQDHLLVYVRYCSMSTFTFVITYLCTVRVAEKTADSMFNIMKTMMSVLELDQGRLVGFCSDGDSTFTGRLNGMCKGPFPPLGPLFHHIPLSGMYPSRKLVGHLSLHDCITV